MCVAEDVFLIGLQMPQYWFKARLALIECYRFLVWHKWF